jgi:hypothetical protein
MTTPGRADRWAAFAVGAAKALMGGMSWLIGGAHRHLPRAACPQCDSAQSESVTPRVYEPESTWYRCRACGRIRSIPKSPTIRE